MTWVWVANINCYEGENTYNMFNLNMQGIYKIKVSLFFRIILRWILLLVVVVVVGVGVDVVVVVEGLVITVSIT